MPELPEVETVSSDLNRNIVGYKISNISSSSVKQFLPSFQKVKSTLTNGVVQRVYRRAKMIVFEITNSNHLYVFVVHLKMTGKFLLDEKQESYSHERTLFVIEKEKKRLFLHFIDVRKFAYLKLFSSKEDFEKEIHRKVGHEPFDSDLTPERLHKMVKRRAISVKVLLMDQAIVAGIGNIYANEILYLAKIHPETKGVSLSRLKTEELQKAIIQIIRQGILNRGTSTKDKSYRDLFNKVGNYQKYLQVYERKDLLCLNGCGGVIKYKKIADRGTFWCDNCQK